MDLRKLTKSINYRLFLLTALLGCVGLSRQQTCFRNLFQTGQKVIFQFECYPPNGVIPIIPTLDTSSPTDFNELDLSPNYFTNISTTDFCQFTNLITLDISYNKLTFISSLFGTFECFSQLQTLKANNNQIATPLLGKQIISNNIHIYVSKVDFALTKYTLFWCNIYIDFVFAPFHKVVTSPQHYLSTLIG